MTAVVPAERVAQILSDVGYRRLALPLRVATLTFDVAAAFVGVGNSADLVIIGDTATDGEPKVVQQIDGIARALDMMRSRRSLTTVIVGPKPVGKALESLAQISRVLAVGEAADPADLRDRLAILLPLELPDSLSADRDLGVDEELTLPDTSIAAELVDASKLGEDAVRTRFHAALTAIFAADSEEEEFLG
ncbi:MAG: hypothetical protein WCC64_15990 [Aliidongia sp.]